MFRKADREQLDRVAKNLVSFMGDVCVSTVNHDAKMRDKEVIWYQEIERSKRCETKLDVLVSVMNSLHADLNKITQESRANHAYVLDRLGVEGKENGLKKAVLKRKSGR